LVNRFIDEYTWTDSEFEYFDDDDREGKVDDTLVATLKRCVALAKASAANGRTRSRRKRVD